MGNVENEDVIWKDRVHHMWFPISFTKYYVANDRLYVEKGFLKTDYNETLLYRVLDIKLTRTLGQKIFGTGDITLYAKADSEGTILLHNIKKPKETKKMFSNLVENIRNKKNIVGKEFYSGLQGGHGGPIDVDGDGIPDIFDGPDDEGSSGF